MTIIFLSFLVLLLVQKNHSNDVAAQTMMMMPVIDQLQVTCTNTGMRVDLTFSAPFNGIVFSKGHFSNPACRYINNPDNNKFQFAIPRDGCGTVTTALSNVTTVENVIIIQSDSAFQEIWDSSRKLVCELSGAPSKKRLLERYRVSMLDFEEVRFPGEFGDVSVRMKLLDGDWPNVKNITRDVRIGDPITVCVEVLNPGASDTSIRNCFAYDSEDINAITTNKIRLIDDNGCPVKTKLFGGFAKNPASSGDKHEHISIMNAFSFPDKMDVFIGCDVELCREGCTDCSGMLVTPSTITPGPDTVTKNPFANNTEPIKCTVGDLRPFCPIVCSDEFTDKRCPCRNGDLRANCPIICSEAFTDNRCPPPSPITPVPCHNGDPRPFCPIICSFTFTDERCPCTDGDLRADCPIVCTSTFTDIRCPTLPPPTPEPCTNGDLRPDCPIVCSETFTDNRCPPAPCTNGDPRPSCPIICSSAFTDQRCPPPPCTNKDPRPFCPIICSPAFTDERCPPPPPITPVPCTNGPDCPVVCSETFTGERCPPPPPITQVPCIDGDPRCPCKNGDTKTRCPIDPTPRPVVKPTAPSRPVVSPTAPISPPSPVKECMDGDLRSFCPIVCTDEFTDSRCACKPGDKRSKCNPDNGPCKPDDKRGICDPQHPFHPGSWKPSKNRTLPPWRQTTKPAFSYRKKRSLSGKTENIEISVIGRFRVVS